MDMQKPTAAVYQQSYCGQFHCKRVFFDMIHCIQTRPPPFVLRETLQWTAPNCNCRCVSGSHPPDKNGRRFYQYALVRCLLPYQKPLELHISADDAGRPQWFLLYWYIGRHYPVKSESPVPHQLTVKAALIIKKRHAARRVFSFWRCHPDSNWGIKVLQTFALPLGHGTIWSG